MATVKTNLLNFNEVCRALLRTEEIVADVFSHCPDAGLRSNFEQKGVDATFMEWMEHSFTIEHDCREEICICHYPQINRVFTHLRILKMRRARLDFIKNSDESE